MPLGITWLGKLKISGSGAGLNDDILLELSPRPTFGVHLVHTGGASTELELRTAAGLYGGGVKLHRRDEQKSLLWGKKSLAKETSSCHSTHTCESLEWRDVQRDPSGW